jgi:hypothetical protein
MFPEDFIPKLAEASRKMRGIPTTRYKPIGLIKRSRGGLENLIISTCPKRRIREGSIKDHRKKRTQKPSVSVQHSTCKASGGTIFMI